MNPDERYRDEWPAGQAPQPREDDVHNPPSLPKRAALWLFALTPWIAYFALVFAAWWLIIFDGDASTDALGWTLLALALPCLFVAASVSRRQRRWIEARYEFETWARRPSGGGGGLLDWLSGP